MIVETIPSMNRATNPSCIHCSDVGFFQFILRDLRPHFGTDSYAGLRNIAENRRDRQVPLLKSPLGNVAPIQVALTPAP
jgi:hypothetical protein